VICVAIIRGQCGGNGSLDVHLGHCTMTPLMLIKHNGGGNDQVDCCCWFCFSCHDIGASNDTRADSPAGYHDHPSRLGLRAGQDNDPWSLRVQSLDPQEPQVFAMDRTHLRSMGLVKTPPNWRPIDHKLVTLHD
jgi:hypothetical protein